MPACPALGPRWDLRARPLRRVGVAFRLLDDVGSHDERYFGAQSHGLQAHCLRFAAGVTPRPRKTRFRLAANLGRAGVATRWIPTRGFELSLHLILLAQALPGAPNTRPLQVGRDLGAGPGMFEVSSPRISRDRTSRDGDEPLRTAVRGRGARTVREAAARQPASRC